MKSFPNKISFSLVVHPFFGHMLCKICKVCLMGRLQSRTSIPRASCIETSRLRISSPMERPRAEVAEAVKPPSRYPIVGIFWGGQILFHLSEPQKKGPTSSFIEVPACFGVPYRIMLQGMMPKQHFFPKPGGELLTLRQVSHICSDWVQHRICGALRNLW